MHGLVFNSKSGQLLVAELVFEVPLVYSSSSPSKNDGKTIRLFGRAAVKYEAPIIPQTDKSYDDPEAFDDYFNKPWITYEEGGPGAGNKEPQNHSLTAKAIARGYQVLFLDYRGTGLSTPINAESLSQLGSAQNQADYLKLFRADNVVRDLEAVRHCLTDHVPEERRTWSLFCQSWGGFVCMTYLSKFPEGIREAFVCGGLPPLDSPAETVYQATYKKLRERNEAYFIKFPEDTDTLSQIAQHLDSRGGAIQLPSGGKLTLQRLLTMGQSFGFHGGFDKVHAMLVQIKSNLDQFGRLIGSTLRSLEMSVDFDDCPIYALLHEPLYCFTKGHASNWAAEKLGKEMGEFRWLSPSFDVNTIKPSPIFFSGEMIYSFMFDQWAELIKMKDAAHILAEYDNWDDLYDLDVLKDNKVPGK